MNEYVYEKNLITNGEAFVWYGSFDCREITLEIIQ